MDAGMNVCRVLAFAVAIAASVQCIGWSGVPTTNEVDAVFADTIFSTNRVESYNRFEAMRKKASELAMHLYTLKNSVSENDIKRHVIFKILAMPIPYDIPYTRYCFEKKAELLTGNASLFEPVFDEDMARFVLGKAALVKLRPAEAYLKLREKAISQDKAFGLHPEFGITYGLGSYPARNWGPNAKKAQLLLHKCLVWNDSVALYRKHLVEFVAKMLDRLWKKMPPEERRLKIEPKFLC